MKIEIGLRQLGQNIILTIEKEQLSKRFTDKKKREAVKTAVEAYNALPKSKQTKRDLNAIKEMMEKEETSSKKSPSTKAKTKKKSTPKKETTVDKPIGFRQLGQNIILKVEGEELSKRFSDKPDREKVKALVNEYNELPKSKRTKTKLKAIKVMMVKSSEETTSTKTSDKKVDKKTTAKQKTISGKQMGQNIILVIDGEKHSKRFPDKEGRTEVLELVQKYNKKNTKTGLERILKLMKKEESKGVEKVNKDVEKLKKDEKAPESTGKLTKEEEIAKAKKLLEENGMEVKEKTASSSRATRKRGGEY